jgi:hypothetical protein
MSFFGKIVCVAVLILVSGCTSYLQNIINKLDEGWAATNSKLAQELGTRYYKMDKAKAQRAMLVALSNLGLLVEQESTTTGFINARGNAPLPLTQQEWARVVAIELPNARAITGSSLIELNAKNREVVINSFILERGNDLQINLRMRLKYTGTPPEGLAIGDQPPPEAMRIGIRKVFDEFEKVGFVQQIVLDK